MKKIISKILIIFIILIMLFEFTFSTNVSYAALDITDEFLNSLTSLMGGMVAYGIWLDRLILLGISTVFNGFMSTTFAACCGVNDGWAVGIATPYSIFFNKYKLFDVNFFDFDKTTSNGPVLSIRQEVAEWFYIMRDISSAVLLCILIYVGMRMALSTIAEEKAKYKKMLFDWGASLALIYVLQYIMIFTVYANNAIVNALKAVYEQNIATPGSGVVDMDTAILQMATQAVMPVGLGSIVATLVYAMIVLQTIAFMISYTQRMLKTGFLILISPLISITYSIDKMGDGKAQALNSWLKEFVYTILIQPFHCLIYMTFVTTAIQLLSKSTILGSLKSIFTGDFNQLTNGVIVILCLKFINDGEKAIRKIFNFQDDDSLTSMAAGAMVGVAALKNAGKIAQTVSGSPNAAKNFMSDLKNTAGKFKNDFKNTSVGKKAASGMSSAKQGISNFASKNPKVAAAAKGVSKVAKNTTSKVKKGGKWVGTKKRSLMQKYEKWSNDKHKAWGAEANDKSKNKHITGAKSWIRKQIPTTHNLRNAMPRALGMMATAMAYAAGDNGAMEALGVGAAVQESSEKLFSNSLGTMSRQNKEANEDWVDSKYDSEKAGKSRAIYDKAKTDEVKKKYETEDARQKVVDQYIKDKKLSESGKATKDQEKEIKEREKELEEDGVLDAVKDKAAFDEMGEEEFKKAILEDRRATSMEELPAGSLAYGVSAIEAQGKEIMQAITEYQRALEGKQGESTESNLTPEEKETRKRMLDEIKRNVEKSLVYGNDSSFDVDSVLGGIGLKNDEKSEIHRKLAYEKLTTNVLKYREMVSNDKVEGIFEQCEKLNIRRATLDKATFKK